MQFDPLNATKACGVHPEVAALLSACSTGHGCCSQGEKQTIDFTPDAAWLRSTRAGHGACLYIEADLTRKRPSFEAFATAAHARAEAASASMSRRSHFREHYEMLSSPSKYKASGTRQKARNVIRSMHRPLLTCGRCTLWGLLAAAVLCFWCITFVRPTRWYRDDTGGHFRAMWETLEVPSASRAGTSGRPVLQGMVSTQVWWPHDCT